MVRIGGLLAVLVALGCPASVESFQEVSPLQKVLQLLTDLHAKVVKEGEAAHQTFAEFSEWCEDRSKNLEFEVKTAKTQIEDLKATISKATSTSTSLSTQIEEISGSVATNEQDLKAATKIRETEEADFAASEKELIEVVGALERAIAVLEREAKKTSPAMLQIQRAGNLIRAIQIMIDASMVSSQDASTLTSLVQSTQQEDDGNDLFSAPEAAAYSSRTGSIIDTLEGLLEKAKEELDTARRKETSSKHNFQMLQQSLTDEIEYNNENLAQAQKNLALQKETVANANGDLTMTQKALAEDEKTKSTLKQDCTTKAQDYEAETKSRGEEVKAILEAKRVITEMTSAAGDLTYSLLQLGPGEAFSFLEGGFVQHAGGWTSADLANFEAVRFVRRLAQQQHSQALAQLARRMAAVMRSDSVEGEDPFAKVKAMISDMIETLERDAQQEATHKAYCDKELGDTVSKKASKEAEVEKLSAKIDSMTAASARLQEEVASLQRSLAEIASAQAELTALRQKEKAVFDQNKPEMESGLEGVKMGLRILREYYAQEGKAHTASEGAGGGIIGLLEIVEGDFTKTLAEMSAAEATAQADYDRETRENEIQKAMKEQSVKYKTKEYKQLDMNVVDASSDRQGVQAELTAILDYNKHLLDICSTKAESYGQRKARREAEIAGLKEALSILEGEASSQLSTQQTSRSVQGTIQGTTRA